MKSIFTLLLFLLSFVSSAQYNYSYTDPCSGRIRSITVQSGQPITVNYYGNVNTFSGNDFNNGVFQNWINGLNTGNSPCDQIATVLTNNVNMIITQNIISITNNISSILIDLSASSISDTLGNIVTNGEDSSTEDEKDSKKSTKVVSNPSSSNSTETNSSSSSLSNVSSNNSTGSNGGSAVNPPISNSSNTSNTTNSSVNSSSSNSSNVNTSVGANSNLSNNTSNSNSTSSSNSVASNSNNTNSSSISKSNDSGSNSQSSSNSSDTNGASTGVGSNSQSNVSNNTSNSNSSNTNQSGVSNNSTNSNQSGSSNVNTGSSNSSNSLNNVATSQNGLVTKNSSDNTQNAIGQSTALSLSTAEENTSGDGKSDKKTGSMIAAGDIVALKSAEDPTSKEQIRVTASITKANTDNTRVRGILGNFTTVLNNTNISLYKAWVIKKKKITIIAANSSMMNFDKDFFNTTTAVVSKRYKGNWKKLTTMGGINFTLGNYGDTKFQNLSAIGGGFYSFNVSKKVSGSVLCLAVYSPFTMFFDGRWWESSTLIVPYSSWDYKITKTFKFNLSMSSVYELNRNVLNYQILMGGKILF